MLMIGLSLVAAIIVIVNSPAGSSIWGTTG
jgi:hypothetical protein